MLGLGWTEMFVVAAVALIVVGPKDLPVMLRQLGRALGTVRRMGNDFRREFNKMSAMDDVMNVRKSLTEPLRNAQAEIQREFNKTTASGVKPSGVIKPLPTEGESVVGALKAEAGMSDASHAASRDEMKEAIERSRQPIPLEPTDRLSALADQSIAGATAKPPAKAKPAPKPRAGSKSARPVETAAAKANPAAKAQAATHSGMATKPQPPSLPKPVAKPATVKKAAKPAAKPRAASTSAAAKSKTQVPAEPAPAKPARRRAASKTTKT